MKVTYLLMWGDELGGLPRAIFAEANYLARRHDVRLFSVLRTTKEGPSDLGSLKLRYVVDATQTPPVPKRRSHHLEQETLEVLVSSRSELVPFEQEPNFNRLTDLELEFLLRGLKTDVLVTTHPPVLEVASRFVRPDVTLVHQEHRTSEERVRALPSLLRAGPRAGLITVLTEESRAWLRDALGRSAPRIEVAAPPLADRVRPRASLDSRTVVVAARLVEEKQLGHLLQAFRALIDRHPDWNLRIFGEGPQQKGLERRILDLGLYNHARIMGPSRSMNLEWSKASIGVLCSKTEGFGLAILEAFAAGVPFVSYDSPNGPRELIRHGHNGLLVPLGSRQGLVEALDRLMTDAELRRSMGANALATAELYQTDRSLQRVQSFYEELVSTAKSRDPFSEALARYASHPLAATQPIPASVRKDAEPDVVGASEMKDERPDLVLDAKKLWHPVDAISMGEVRRRNLDSVVEQLEHNEIPYILLSDERGFAPVALSRAEDRPTARSGYRIAVEDDLRGRLLEVLTSAFGDDAVYAIPLIRGEPIGPEILIRDLARDPSVEACTGFAIGRYYISKQRTVRFGPPHLCEVELWQRGDDGVLRMPVRSGGQAPQNDELLERVPDDLLMPASRTIEGRRYVSAPPFIKPRVGVVDFPIDIVYTWVDGDDPQWQQRREAFAADGQELHTAAASSSRYRNHDELRYSLRSIAMNMPWVRHVYIVTDQQVPSWLDVGASGVTIVDHKEIFSAGEGLPTFNSHAIESQLHHIDGLSEHYLYFNDDVFVGRAVTPELFFFSNGIAKFFPSPAMIPFGPASPLDEPHFAAGKNCRELIERTFGYSILRPFLHTPHPQIRSVLTEIEDRFPDEIDRTAKNRFRHPTDIACASNLHHYYAYLTKRAVPGEIRWMYVNVSDPRHQGRLLRLLRTRDVDSFCLNDLLTDESSEDEQHIALRNVLERYFPFPSVAEADAPGATLPIGEGE